MTEWAEFFLNQHLKKKSNLDIHYKGLEINKHKNGLQILMLKQKMRENELVAMCRIPKIRILSCIHSYLFSIFSKAIAALESMCPQFTYQQKIAGS